jgi:hypothetical protein
MGQHYPSDHRGHPGEPADRSPSAAKRDQEQATAGELSPQGELASQSCSFVSPLIQRAEDAFRRDLQQLLDERPGQWVAYHGDQRIGFAATKQQLYRECLARGLPRGEFLILSIEPEMGDLILGPGAIGDIAGGVG